MITLKQREDLRALATPQKYRVVAQGPKIMVTSKCMTVQFSNDDTGYVAALGWLAASMEGRERAKEKTAQS